ncbi:MAG: hypothetical protein ACI9VN_002948, partial [Patescibacteria group bacterium]
SLMACLFCFTATVEAQVNKRVITNETVTVRQDVCLKGEAHKYKSLTGKRVLVKQRVKPARTKRFVCGTTTQSALRAERIAKKRATIQTRKKAVKRTRSLQKKSVQHVPAKE